MKRLIWVLMLVCLVSLVFSEPVLVVNQETPEQWPCEEFKVIQKWFVARNEKINVGLICPEDARIQLFECSGEKCNYLIEAYKEKGDLPSFDNFQLGSRYMYECYSCEGTCALSVTETEKVNLNKFFQGVQFRVSTPRAGLNDQGVWVTEKGDAGDYNVFVDLYDSQEWEKVKFCVHVEKLNEFPTLEVTKEVNVNEGDLLLLDVDCFDPEGEETVVEFKGWAEEARKRVSFEDSGKHKINVVCSDGFHSVQEEIVVNVNDVNRAPVIENIFNAN
jgi:hypothetical protein